jgi:hypothetical protein
MTMQRFRAMTMQFLGFVLLFAVSHCQPAYGQGPFTYTMVGGGSGNSLFTGTAGAAISINGGGSILTSGTYTITPIVDGLSSQYSLFSSLTAYGGYQGGQLSALNTVPVTAYVTGPPPPAGVQSYGIDVTFGIRGVAGLVFSGTNMINVTGSATTDSPGMVTLTVTVLNGGATQWATGVGTLTEMVNPSTVGGGGETFTVSSPLPSTNMLGWSHNPAGEAYGKIQANLAVKVWVYAISGLGITQYFPEPTTWHVPVPPQTNP